MTEIEKKALALVNEVQIERGSPVSNRLIRDKYSFDEALCRVVEQHEAFRQEVSDKIETLLEWPSIRSQAIIASNLSPFILPKPVDPLEDVLREAGYAVFPDDLERVRAALAARGLTITETKE